MSYSSDSSPFSSDDKSDADDVDEAVKGQHLLVLPITLLRFLCEVSIRNFRRYQGRPIWALRVGALAEKLKDRDVTEVSVYGNKLSDDSRAAVQEMWDTKSTSLQVYESDVCLKFEGCQALARAITINETLKRICLEGHSFGDEGCVAIAEALKVNKTLLNIDLSRKDGSLHTHHKH